MMKIGIAERKIFWPGFMHIYNIETEKKENTVNLPQTRNLDLDHHLLYIKLAQIQELLPDHVIFVYKRRHFVVTSLKSNHLWPSRAHQKTNHNRVLHLTLTQKLKCNIVIFKKSS